jgi:hypothetical protein
MDAARLGGHSSLPQTHPGPVGASTRSRQRQCSAPSLFVQTTSSLAFCLAFRSFTFIPVLLSVCTGSAALPCPVLLASGNSLWPYACAPHVVGTARSAQTPRVLRRGAHAAVSWEMAVPLCAHRLAFCRGECGSQQSSRLSKPFSAPQREPASAARRRASEPSHRRRQALLGVVTVLGHAFTAHYEQYTVYSLPPSLQWARGDSLACGPLPSRPGLPRSPRHREP